jgi:hypothetical protein
MPPWVRDAESDRLAPVVNQNQEAPRSVPTARFDINDRCVIEGGAEVVFALDHSKRSLRIDAQQYGGSPGWGPSSEHLGEPRLDDAAGEVAHQLHDVEHNPSLAHRLRSFHPPMDPETGSVN